MFSLAHFYKLPSIVQILVAELLMTVCLGGLAPYAHRAIWPRQLSYTPLPLGWSDFAFGAVGLVLLVWLMWGPLFPRIAAVSWTPVFHTGKLDAIVVMPSASVDYGFATNHPSYVFIDAIVIGFWWFFRWIMADNNDERLYEANLWVSIATVVPAWRLICWYGLRRRPEAGEAVRDAWKPVANLYVYFIGPLIAVFLILFGYEALKSRRILANMPTIEAASFSEQRFEELRDRGVTDKVATGYLRIRAIQRSAEAQRCFDRERRPSTTVLADFGRHGGLIIINDRTVRDDLHLDTLGARAKDNAGKPIEAIGRLLRMPADRDIPGWRRPFYCGLDRAEPRARWVLEESKP